MKYPIPQPLFDTMKHLDCTPRSLETLPEFAQHDYQECLSFLQQYTGNSATFESYRREIERLIQWAWLIEKKSILELKRNHVEKYINFCLDPPNSWIGLKKVSRFVVKNAERIPNKEWRPFVATVSKTEYKQGIKPEKNKYQLSQKAIREIFTVLGSFYNFLAIEEKVPTNPIEIIKQKSKYLQKQQQEQQVMRLTEKQWQTCVETAKELADTDPAKHERTLFIISMLYLLYLRISELVENERWSPQMNHFYQDSNGCWWFKTVGKGNKMRNIAVSDDMLTALKRYRNSMQLRPLPSPADKGPLISKEKGKGGVTSSRHIRSIVQYCFNRTIQKLRNTGFINDATTMESATVHWLRHTGISDDINKRNRPIAHVRDDAGHSSSSITDRYNNIELLDRHKSAKRKKITVTN